MRLSLRPRRLHLLVSSGSIHNHTVNLIVPRLALNGLVYVLDGGNRFDAHGLARALRLLTDQYEIALQRVQIMRAFTCHQMAALLAGQGQTPAPVLVLELLDTFRDENMPARERQRLLGACMTDLRRLAGLASVLVALSNSRALPEHLARLYTAADHAWEFDEPGVQLQLPLL
jgi:hypothetical protein